MPPAAYSGPMKTRGAVALAVAGILVTGSAAFAVNTGTLNNSRPGTTGDANKVLLPDVPAAGTPAAPLDPTPTDVGGPGTPSPSPPAGNTGGVPGAAPSDQAAAPVDRAAAPGPTGSGPAPVPGTAPVPGGVPVQPTDDKGGLRKAPEPGDDSGRNRGRSGGGSDD